MRKQNYLRYEWKTSRPRFLTACANTMLEAGVTQEHFGEECAAMFLIAEREHIAFHLHGSPTAEQKRKTRKRVYNSFYHALHAKVYHLMPKGECEGSADS